MPPRPLKAEKKKPLLKLPFQINKKLKFLKKKGNFKGKKTEYGGRGQGNGHFKFPKIKKSLEENCLRSALLKPGILKNPKF